MTLEDALEALEQEKKHRAKINRWLIGGTAAMVAIAAAGLGFNIASGGGSFLEDFLPFAGLIGLFGMAAGFSPRAKTALTAAAESGDPRVLGHLVEAMGLGDPETQALAKPIVQNLFASAGPDSLPLDSVQHAVLHQLLAIHDDAFRIAAVRALPWVGRAESLALLEALAAGQRLGQLPTSPELKGTAALALPDLRIRLAKEIILAKIAQVDEERSRLRDRLSPLQEPLSPEQEQVQEAP